MSSRGILFVLSGPSGVGKGTVTEVISQKLSNIVISISTSTRKPRQGELNGKDYFFVDEHSFKAMIEQGEFLEWAKVYSNYYGTPLSFVEEKRKAGVDVLLEIDIQGALQVKEKMPEAVFIFLAPPSFEELSERLSKRAKDSKESMQKRLAAFTEEMKHKSYYDYCVINEHLHEAVEKLTAIVIAERCRVNR